MSNNTINLIPFIIEVMTSEKKLYKSIDAIYKKNKLRYYNAIRKSPLRNHPFFAEGDIKKDLYSKKLLGILLTAEECKETNQDLYKLVVKGWPGVVNYVEENEEIDLEELLHRFCRRSMTDDQFNAVILIGYWLARSNGKKIVENEAYNVFTNMIISRQNFISAPERLTYKNLTPEILTKVKSLQNRIFDYMNIDVKYPGDIYSPNLNDDLRKLSEGYFCLFDTENLSFSSITNEISITKKDIAEIIAAYYSFHFNQNKEEASKFFLAGFLIKCLLKSYNLNKEYYFKNDKETIFLEGVLKTNVDSLTEENMQLKEKINALEREIAYLKKDYKEGLEKQLLETLKENEKLKETIQKHKENKKELVALRTAMFERKAEPVFTEETEEALAIPEDINCIIVGGHEAWHNKLKKEFPPNFSFLSGDKLNFDPKVLDNIDIVFFYVNYGMNHGMYYKVVNHCKRKDIKIAYLNNTQTSLVKKEIGKIIKMLFVPLYY